MSHIIFDPYQWETVTQHGGSGPHAWSSVGQRQRAPEDVARIKEVRQRKEDDEILRRADEIRARRYYG